MFGGTMIVFFGTVLGLAWQALKLVALYYGIRLIICTCSYISTAEKKLNEPKLPNEQIEEVIRLLRSIEEYQEHNAIRNKS